MDLVKHQPRERAVLCRQCGRRETWAVNAVCHPCTERSIYGRQGSLEDAYRALGLTRVIA